MSRALKTTYSQSDRFKAAYRQGCKQQQKLDLELNRRLVMVFKPQDQSLTQWHRWDH